uniref:Uncharacterized protein n=1 Tax=Schizaphis graminum TaxID=13262 RepID=A0A2S2PIK9_SCHGA
MIKHISLPFVLKHLNINTYYKSYRKAITNLISPFKESLSTSARQNIASHYAASRIIRISYELIEYNKIGILAEELLFEMLFYLSSAYLEINHHWPGGIDMFRNQMVWSFKNFPKTPKDLCFVLTNSTNTDIRHFIIIFIYFYLLTCSNDEKESIYLEPMCDYLCSIQNEIPIPVIKAILFNISICFVSHHAVNAISGLEFATKKLVELINSKIIDSIFTHHPALLYFLFASSIIPEKIQLQLIKQWVQNSDEICLVELEKFCLNNHKAKLCLMDVLINDTNIDNNKLHSGFNIVKKIITKENECNEHKTLLIIWDMLPIYLGLFCCTNNSKGIGATNLTFLLNLTEPCSLRGINISINEHRSIVYTMSSIIKIHQSTSTEQYSLLSSLLQHLITLIQFSNTDVLNTIKKNKDFLYALENLCLSKNNNICFLAINTVIQLCQLEQEETNMEHKLLYSITLKCEYILNAMTRLCQNCILSSITLFKIILKYYEEGICKLVELTEAPSVDFLKTIFMQLKTIISQGLDRVSDQAWECITTILSTKLLKHLQELTYLKIEFATDPWLNFILLNSKSFSERCLEFLYTWLKHFVINDENNFTIRGSKVLCPSLFDSTIVHISVTLVNQVYERSELISKAKFIIQLILENKFSLPNELEGKMNIFLN